YSIALIGFGLSGTLIFQWFRGAEQGAKTTRIEIILQSANFLAASYFIYGIATTPMSIKVVENVDAIENSIAVLPFQNLGSNNDTDFYGDGFADDIITSLSKSSDFMVISRTSSFQYRDTNRSIKQIRNQLKVETILEGSFRVHEDKIRLNVYLVQTESEKNLWSETFTGNVRDIFSLQSLVAKQIAKSLQLELKTSKSEREVDVLAYEYYRKGSDLMRQNNISKNILNESVEALNKAIEIDSTFVEALTTIAEVYIKYLYWGYDEYDNVAPKAREYIRIAQQYSADEAEIYALLAALSHYNFEWKEAEKYCKMAKELNPNAIFTYWVDAKNSIVLGKKKQAISSINMLLKLDPLTSTNAIYFSMIRGYFRDFDIAIEFLNKSLENNPNDNFTLWNMAYLHGLLGNYTKAIEYYKKRTVKSKDENWGLGYAYGRLGEKEEAVRIAEILIKKKKSGSFVPSFMIGYVFLGAGELDNAFYWFNIASNEKLGWLGFIESDPSFDDVREDEKYKQLLQKVNLD
ncbi:MAG: hypothetical protein OEW67_05615, partial [Cyclobacteriaceae bacterium]|nr:hypothetical protein [Cyclobacteriaceae bacterium]